MLNLASICWWMLLKIVRLAVLIVVTSDLRRR